MANVYRSATSVTRRGIAGRFSLVSFDQQCIAMVLCSRFLPQVFKAAVYRDWATLLLLPRFLVQVRGRDSATLVSVISSAEPPTLALLALLTRGMSSLTATPLLPTEDWATRP